MTVYNNEACGDGSYEGSTLIKSFQIQDVGSLASLQKSGQKLDLVERLIHAYSPLRSALLTAVLPSDSVTSTYILDSTDENEAYRGLIQTRRRPGRPEQEVVFLGPSLGQSKGSHAIWQRLLAHACVKAGEAGQYRIYARLEADSEAAQIFRNVGFTSYVEENVYILPPQRMKQTFKNALTLRKQSDTDSWGLQRLYAATTPRAVQIAEGLAQGHWQLNGRPFYDRNQRRGYVWERDGEILAAIHLRRGRTGLALRFLIHPNELEQASLLIQASLATIQNLGLASGRIIYATVRTYQAGLSLALAEAGFKPVATQVVMVKHTTVRVKDVFSRLIDFEAPVEVKSAVPAPFTKGQIMSNIVPTQPTVSIDESSFQS